MAKINFKNITKLYYIRAPKKLVAQCATNSEKLVARAKS